MSKEEYIFHRASLAHMHVDFQTPNHNIKVLYEYYNMFNKVSYQEFMQKFQIAMSLGMNTPMYINEVLTFFDQYYSITLLYDKNKNLLKIY